jgi:hypothetical protein
MPDKPQMPPEAVANVEANAKLAKELADQLAPIMVRYPAHAIGAALSSLVASWLSGYRGRKDEPGSGEKMRTLMFASLMRAVMQELPEIMKQVEEEEGRPE